MEAVSEVVGSIAREIGGPLTAIEMAVDRLRGEGMPGGRGDLELRIILEQSHRLGGLARTLLSLARPAHASARPFDVNVMAGKLLDLVRTEMESLGIELTFESGPDGLIALGDVSQVREVLLALVQNARRALQGREGTGAVRVSASLFATGQVGIRVEDNGPGVPAGEEERIFLPFVSTWGREGVGLALSRLALMGQGGELLVDPSSRLGGAAFTIVLPALDAEGQEDPLEAWP